MSQPVNNKARIGKLIAGIAISLVLAAGAPYFMVISVSVCVYPVFAAFLYAFSGIIPAMCCMLFTPAAFYVYFGYPAMLMAFAAFTLPSTVILRMLKWRRPFFSQMRAGIVAQISGILAALIIAYAFVGSELTTALASWLDSVIKTLSPGLQDILLSQLYGLTGAPATLTTDELLTGFLEAAQRASYLEALHADVAAFTSLMLPGYLISSSILTGVLASFWGNYAMRKQSGDSAYVPVSIWHTPMNITLSLLGAMGISYVAYYAGLASAETIYMTVRSILFMVFRIQAAISLERRLKGVGVKAWGRVLAIIALEIIAGEFIIYYGGASAIAGSTGVFRQIRARHGSNDKN